MCECQGRCWLCGGTTEGMVILVGWRGCDVAMLDVEMAWTRETALDQLSKLPFYCKAVASINVVTRPIAVETDVVFPSVEMSPLKVVRYCRSPHSVSVYVDRVLDTAFINELASIMVFV